MSRGLTRFRYLLGEAVDNVRANRTTTFLALATTTFTMLGMGVFLDRKSTRLNSSHIQKSRMPSSA